MEKTNPVRKYFHDVFNIKDDMMTYEEIDRMMNENTIIHGSNMWILMLAILIASIGLNVNSTAVIIGAMLISPLMNGIMTMGYSIAVRDTALLVRAFRHFMTQVVISLIISTLYFVISPLDVPTSEMIARTSPTLWDVLIAMFGGIAGMIGNTRNKKGNVIPGVAIATALMPPLCTAGYGIATWQSQFMLGGAYLFVINTMFIALSTGIVTIILGVPYHKTVSEKQQRRINRNIAVLAAIVVIPSIFIGTYTVYETVLDRSISSYIDSEFNFENTQVVKTDVDKKESLISVSLVGETLPDNVIEALKDVLPEYGLESFTLRITQNVSGSTENGDKITIAVQENKISELEDSLDEQEQVIAELKKKVSGEYADYRKMSEDAVAIFAPVKSCKCGELSDKSGTYVFVSAETTEDLTEEEQESIRKWASIQSGIDKCILEYEVVE